MPPVMQATLMLLFALAVVIGPLMLLSRRAKIQQQPTTYLRLAKSVEQAIVAAEKLCRDLTVRLDHQERITASLGHDVYILRIAGQEKLISREFAEDLIREHIPDPDRERQAFDTLTKMARRVHPHLHRDYSALIEHK